MKGHMHSRALKEASQQDFREGYPSSKCASAIKGQMVTILPCAPSCLVCILAAALYTTWWSLTARLTDLCLSAQLPFLPSAR